MDMNRKRPPKNCEDLELWLSGTINDAIRDATEAGLRARSAAFIALSYGRSAASFACMRDRDIARAVGLDNTTELVATARKVLSAGWPDRDFRIAPEFVDKLERLLNEEDAVVRARVLASVEELSVDENASAEPRALVTLRMSAEDARLLSRFLTQGPVEVAVRADPARDVQPAHPGEPA